VVGVEVEKMRAAEARKRQQGGQGGVLLKANLPEASRGQARDQAARDLDVSPRLISEAKRLAAEIRLRAERRAGELLREMKTTGQRHNGAGENQHTRVSRGATPTLPDLGISRDQGSPSGRQGDGLRGGVVQQGDGGVKAGLMLFHEVRVVLLRGLHRVMTEE
jgi:hypothetical protein